jgi:hypothetical protein
LVPTPGVVAYGNPWYPSPPVLLVNHVCANKKQSLHFSDFYHIMDKEDSDAYNER